MDTHHEQTIIISRDWWGKSHPTFLHSRYHALRGNVFFGNLRHGGMTGGMTGYIAVKKVFYLQGISCGRKEIILHFWFIQVMQIIISLLP